MISPIIDQWHSKVSPKIRCREDEVDLIQIIDNLSTHIIREGNPKFNKINLLSRTYIKGLKTIVYCPHFPYIGFLIKDKVIHQKEVG